jgi:hypothetical protein
MTHMAKRAAKSPCIRLLPGMLSKSNFLGGKWDRHNKLKV